MPQILGVEVHIWADGVALVFTIFAVILCGLQIHNHIAHNHVPQVRKYIIRILLMVVVYGIESLCGLYYPEWSIYLNALRDCYEALVIYSFYQLLIQSLGGHEAVQSALKNVPMSTKPHMKPFNWYENSFHFFFFCFCNDALFVIFVTLQIIKRNKLAKRRKR